jgi:hypothetical protein
VTLRSNYAGCQANRKIVRMGGAARLLALPFPAGCRALVSLPGSGGASAEQMRDRWTVWARRASWHVARERL